MTGMTSSIGTINSSPPTPFAEHSKMPPGVHIPPIHHFNHVLRRPAFPHLFFIGWTRRLPQTQRKMLLRTPRQERVNRNIYGLVACLSDILCSLLYV